MLRLLWEGVNGGRGWEHHHRGGHYVIDKRRVASEATERQITTKGCGSGSSKSKLSLFEHERQPASATCTAWLSHPTQILLYSSMGSSDGHRGGSPSEKTNCLILIGTHQRKGQKTTPGDYKLTIWSARKINGGKRNHGKKYK